jgi:competence protein ComEC
LSASFSLLSVLYSFKHHFDISIERLLPQPDASMLEGILLGERRGLPAAVTQALVIAGLIHIVILSGYSMSVVSEGVVRSLRFLPRRAQMLLAALLVILFVLMTGAAATTVRACTMALVALAARYFHRQALALRSLVLVACAMVIWKPPMLLEDASFIVSVLATFGLIVFAPSIERRLKFIKNPEARSILTSTFAVQIFALPILIYYTGNISFLSLPANILVLPLLPLIMISGLLAGLFGFLSPLLALIPAFIVDLLLRWILLVVAVVQVIPFSSTTIVAFPLWAALACYVPLTWIAVWLVRRQMQARLISGS